jgi:hypothetical protein
MAARPGAARSDRSRVARAYQVEPSWAVWTTWIPAICSSDLTLFRSVADSPERPPPPNGNRWCWSGSAPALDGKCPPWKPAAPCPRWGRNRRPPSRSREGRRATWPTRPSRGGGQDQDGAGQQGRPDRAAPYPSTSSSIRSLRLLQEFADLDSRRLQALAEGAGDGAGPGELVLGSPHDVVLGLVRGDVHPVLGELLVHQVVERVGQILFALGGEVPVELDHHLVLHAPHGVGLPVVLDPLQDLLDGVVGRLFHQHLVGGVRPRLRVARLGSQQPARGGLVGLDHQARLASFRHRGNVAGVGDVDVGAGGQRDLVGLVVLVPLMLPTIWTSEPSASCPRGETTSYWRLVR